MWWIAAAAAQEPEEPEEVVVTGERPVETATERVPQSRGRSELPARSADELLRADAGAPPVGPRGQRQGVPVPDPRVRRRARLGPRTSPSKGVPINETGQRPRPGVPQSALPPVDPGRRPRPGEGQLPREEQVCQDRRGRPTTTLGLAPEGLQPGDDGWAQTWSPGGFVAFRPRGARSRHLPGGRGRRGNRRRRRSAPTPSSAAQPWVQTASSARPERPVHWRSATTGRSTRRGSCATDDLLDGDRRDHHHVEVGVRIRGNHGELRQRTRWPEPPLT